MNIERLKQIEKSPEIKEKYLSSGGWVGGNNVMYIPVLLIVVSLMWLVMFLYFLTDMGSQATIINVAVSLAVAGIGYLWLRYAKKALLRKGKAQLDDFLWMLIFWRISLWKKDWYLDLQKVQLRF